MATTNINLSNVATQTQVNSIDGRVTTLEDNQFSNAIVVQTFADEGGGLTFLPITGTEGVSYKVANDPDPSLNGYYHWEDSLMDYVKDANIVLSKIQPLNDSEAASSSAIDKYVNKTILPYNSRFDANTPITSNTAGAFTKTLGTGNLSFFNSDSLRIENTAAANFVLSNNTILDSNAGQQFYYRFYAKWNSGTKDIYISAGDSFPVSIYTNKHTLTDEYLLYEGQLTVGTSQANRIAIFFIAATDVIIKDFQVLLDDSDFGVKTQDIELLQSQVEDLNTEVFDVNIVPSTSRFDDNTVISGTDIGEFSFSLGSDTVDEITIEDEGVKIDITGTGGNVNFNDNTIISNIPNGNFVNCQFRIKWLEGNSVFYFAVTTSTVGATQISPSSNWQTINVKLLKGTDFPNRLSFFWVAVTGKQTVIIKDLIVDDTEIQFGEIGKLKNRVDFIEDELGINNDVKKMSIIGDSISTASDNNAVELEVLASDVGNNIQAYVTKYDFDSGLTIGGYTVLSSDIGLNKTFTPDIEDVGKVIGKPLNFNSLNQNQVWWGILAERKGWEVLQNVSWSGSSISSHEGNLEQYKTSYAWHPAQINKCQKRNNIGVYETPDIIIVYRGTNDFSHTPYTKLTSFGADATQIPSDDIVNISDYGFKEAIALLVETLRETYPQAEIVLCTLNIFKRVTFSNFPTQNPEGTLPQYNNAIREVANQMGCRIIEFDKSGITFENIYPTYSNETPNSTHPNAIGHLKLAEKAIKDLM